MNLFGLIPGNFFSLLASGNREIYFDALMLLNGFVKNELNIRVEDYISSLISLLEDRTFIPEEEDETPEMDEPERQGGGLSPNTKAHLILNRIVRTGWADRETMDGSFAEIITPRDYAIRMMQLLDELRDEKIREYNSLVFSTYSALKQAKSEQPREMFEAVLAARRNTEHLTYELRSLYHNIRTYLRRIQEQNNINELLENHFEKYKPMTDRIYHPIKTMDSIHRYMTPIRDLLVKLRDDDELISRMRERAMTVRKYEQEDEAGEEILSAIDYVLETYGGLGGVINEIDRKHGAYTKNSIEKMTYMMTADQSIKGKLLDILKAYAAGPNRGAIAAMLEKNIGVYRQEFLDGKSLYHKNILGRRFNGESLEISAADGVSLDMEGLLHQIQSAYSLDRIRRFVEGLFAAAGFTGDGILKSESLPINEDADFILLILALVRSNERGMDYTVKVEEGRVERNGYVIPNMTIRRKREKAHV
ncbi:MAG: DUF5716 family protein [Spirochaetaceae bacterium]|jgi:hypothetical protein|nr:DUF5716 family protein [Spirochaetaceae bacterium]